MDSVEKLIEEMRGYASYGCDYASAVSHTLKQWADRLAALKAAQPASTKESLDVVRAAMQADPHYAWTWHCNVAMAAVDAGAGHREANERAADFMRRAFDFDTRKCDEWPIDVASSSRPQPARNQCDGCNAGFVLDGNMHRHSDGKPYMVCTADRYAQPAAAEDECSVNEFSSRVCARGTRSCEATHASLPVQPAADEPVNGVMRCLACGAANWIPDSPRPAPDTEAAPQRWHFGEGKIIVCTGTLDGRPAVFVSSLRPDEPAGSPGARCNLPRDLNATEPGELVLTFPTQEQASAVADSLSAFGSTQKAAPDMEKVLQGWKVVARDGQPSDGLYVALHGEDGSFAVALCSYGDWEYSDVDGDAPNADEEGMVRGHGWSEDTEDRGGDGFVHLRKVVAYLPFDFQYTAPAMKAIRAALASLGAQEGKSGA